MTNSTASTVPALCSECGAERTVKFGGKYRPNGWDYETNSAKLKCSACGCLRLHAVSVPHVPSSWWAEREAVIAKWAEMEAAGIHVSTMTFGVPRDGEVKQFLDSYRWCVYIDERLSPADLLKALEIADSYVESASGMRWWVIAETGDDRAVRWFGFNIKDSGPSWRLSDRTTELWP